jgi:hypothetical protein
LIEANGYGAILATPGEPSDAIKALMQRMAAMTQRSRCGFLARAGRSCRRHIVEIAPTTPASRGAGRHGAHSRRRIRLQGAGH